MLQRILNLMRGKIRRQLYVMTLHAEEEMNEDGLTIFDVEHGILSGKILERQKDKATAEWKYRIRGQTVSGGKVEIIAKLSPTDKLIIITAYAT